jgi:hypothetical protein
MATSQLIFFLCWLAIALVGGALLYFVWARLRAKWAGE